MLTKVPTRRRVTAVALTVLALASCSNGSEPGASAEAPGSLPTAGLGLAPFCGVMPPFRALNDRPTVLRTGDSVDLGIVVGDGESDAAVEHLRLGIVPPEEAAAFASRSLDGDITTKGRVLSADGVSVPGEIRVPFDGRDDAGAPMPPGRYTVVVSVDFAVDDHGRCPGNALPDGPFRGWVRESTAGELGTLVIEDGQVASG